MKAADHYAFKLWIVASTVLASTLSPAADTPRLTDLKHTFSIIATDPATGEFGAGVQTHWFNVGQGVLWAEVGVGAVASQSFLDPAYGAHGLAMMRQGKTAQEVLDELVAHAYRFMERGDEHLAHGDVKSALDAFDTAMNMMPDNHEMMFWTAVTLVGVGDIERARPLFAKSFAMWPLWRELVPRLPVSNLLPDDPELIARIVGIE